MVQQSVLRRFLPLGALAVIQLLIIAVAPSQSPQSAGSQDVATGFLPGGALVDPETGQVFDPTTGEIFDPNTGEVIGTTDAGGGFAGGPTGTAGPGGTAGRPTAPGATTPGGSAGGGAAAKADTSHCAGDRQYDPGIFPWAPACFPKFTGNNNGATYQGVTSDTIKIVAMRGNYGSVVDAALTASGGNPTAPDYDQMLRAIEKFVNARYELYGRRFVIKQRKFSCGTGGDSRPDPACLRNEARQIVNEEKPFAVVFINPATGPFFNELANLKVVSVGGYGNPDSFMAQNRPYHWDVGLSGTQMARLVGAWYCKRMAGGNAIHAGDRNPAENLRTRPRVLGVAATDEPETREAVAELEETLTKGCGVSIKDKTYYYSPTVDTAPAQRRATIEKMRQAPMATTVLCWCDQVAPSFLYDEEELNNYYPENLMVGTPYMDKDNVAQTYDHFFDPQRPKDEYPTYENAFGLAQEPPGETRETYRGARVWKAAGSTGTPAFEASGEADYYLMLATMAMYAGPTLTPQNLEAGAFRIGTLGNGSAQAPPRSFKPGDYNWNDGMREVYWATKKVAPYNGVSGAYGNVSPNWYTSPGAFPSGQLALPPKPRSS